MCSAVAGQLLVLIAFIVACIMGSRSDGGSQGVAFAAVWTVLLAMGLSVRARARAARVRARSPRHAALTRTRGSAQVGGTLVMRKYQTSIAIGFFLGVVRTPRARANFFSLRDFEGQVELAAEAARQGLKGM